MVHCDLALLQIHQITEEMKEMRQGSEKERSEGGN